MAYHQYPSYQLLLLLTVLCASTQLLLNVYAGETKTTSTEEVRASSRRLPKNNLTCYVCHSETQSDCLNFIDEDMEEKMQKFESPCEEKETSCIVKKISFTTSTGNHANSTLPMKTVAVKRNCTKKCEPGCVIMGERTRLYVCSTCCTNNLCNVGSGSSCLSISIPNFSAVSIMWIFSINIVTYFPSIFSIPKLPSNLAFPGLLIMLIR